MLPCLGKEVEAILKQGRWKEAEDLNLQVIETSSKALGAEHPYTLTSMHNLAFTWKGQGHARKALALIEDCFRYQTRCIGLDHPETQSTLRAINQWREECGLSSLET